jgi:integrase
VAGLDPHLFVTRRHGKLSRTVVNQTFREVLQAAGIPREAGRPRPRLMDLRHTFAVRALEHSPETREQIGRHKPRQNPRYTYGYLQGPSYPWCIARRRMAS